MLGSNGKTVLSVYARARASTNFDGIVVQRIPSRQFGMSDIFGLSCETMRIGELARSVNVTVETIRYYQRIGLLGLPAKPYGGTRSYRFEDLQRLRFIRRAQQLGFSLEDIRELLELSSADCARVEKLAAEKLNLVKAKLTQLRRIQSVLARTIGQCAGRKGNQPCPIIETLTETK
jgi:MerR family transcriptional regulator, mercuric resistance operon regulatory protein